MSPDHFRVVVHLCAAADADIAGPHEEYDEVASTVEWAGGFLHVLRAGRARPHAPCR
ncbi:MULTISPECIES: hypothetical protein [Streptomyces]|uniref:hypothetical protein n=1 Tax=Streptomyces TaxID=1883 RepID=UPI000AF48D2F|nr:MULTISPECIES: hypothetical protein [Streptomyces]